MARSFCEGKRGNLHCFWVRCDVLWPDPSITVNTLFLSRFTQNIYVVDVKGVGRCMEGLDSCTSTTISTPHVFHLPSHLSYLPHPCFHPYKLVFHPLPHKKLIIGKKYHLIGSPPISHKKHSNITLPFIRHQTPMFRFVTFPTISC